MALIGQTGSSNVKQNKKPANTPSALDKASNSYDNKIKQHYIGF